jgi:hypothetical protein
MPAIEVRTSARMIRNSDTALMHKGLSQIGSYGGISDELENLKRDKNVLMLELVRLRQQQQVCSHAQHGVSHTAFQQPFSLLI